jgi:hypothetical protein
VCNSKQKSRNAGILLIHNNAWLYSAAHLQDIITSFGGDGDDDDDVEDAVQKWLRYRRLHSLRRVYKKLVPCYDKCLSNGSDYVEK